MIRSWNLTEVIETLEAKGMVDRARDSRDGPTRLQLTAPGRQHHAIAAQLVETVSGDFEDAMPAPDRAALGSIASKLLTRLE
jgi:DNA-binding MarR family transcriptional regulator